MIDSLIQLYHRDLDRLQREIEQYQSEEGLWSTDKNISNSGGTLALHLLGNLNHFIGAVLGNTGYVRNREAEFSDTLVDREKIYNDISVLKQTIKDTLDALSDETLASTYPISIRKEAMSVQQFLFHLYGHLNYHLGQINYHRRLCDKC